MSELRWFVAHVKPRREKKLKASCERDGLKVTLPCYRTVHTYRGKTVVFNKPLFPGYVFLRVVPEESRKLGQSGHVAGLLFVYDQELFEHQLQEITAALETGLDVFLAPQIGAGSRVKVKSGPLGGMDGWVEERYGMSTVLLRLDFIGQAAAVKMHADEVELL